MKFKTASDIDVDTYYHLLAGDPNKKLGVPGAFPFTRGIHPEMYRKKLWTTRQYAGFGSAQETNLLYRELLSQGQTGLSVAFDLPTQLGLDADHVLAEGEVGRVGVSVNSILDMEYLFSKIDLNNVSVSMTINAPAAIILAMFIAIMEKKGIDLSKLRGTIQNDILKEYIARGTYIFPPEPSLKLTADIIEYCSQFCPKFNPISVSGYHIREAGSTAVQELAITLLNAFTYIDTVLQRGLCIDDFAPRISFFWAAHTDFFEEIAKFRAARRIWAEKMNKQYHAQNEASMKMRFHVQTAGSTLTRQQPENNIIRVTLQALAAVLGGTQSLHTNSSDEAISLPTKKNTTIALRTQQIIAYESNVINTVDPLGGSYYIEYLTDTIENRVYDYMAKIEKNGGLISTIRSGFIKNEIQQKAYERELKIERGEVSIVGVNKFVDVDVNYDYYDFYKGDEKLRQRRINELKALKKARDESSATKSLAELEAAARSGTNLIPYFIRAAKNYCTLGEMCNILKKVYGAHSQNF